MPDTAAQKNNRAIVFRRKGIREMPSVSRSQNRFMHAAAEGKIPGVPRSVGRDFVKADEGRKIGKLPLHKTRKKSTKHHVRRAMARGLISEKVAKDHFGYE